MGYFITFKGMKSKKSRFVYLRDWTCVIRWLKRMEQKCECIHIEKEAQYDKSGSDQ